MQPSSKMQEDCATQPYQTTRSFLEQAPHAPSTNLVLMGKERTLGSFHGDALDEL